MWQQVKLVGGALFVRGGGDTRRRQRWLLLVDEESVEAPTGGCRRHGPNDEFDGEGHDFCNLVAKHDGEQSREPPYGCLDRLSLRGVAVQALVVAQAGEQGDEVEVGDHNEDD